MYPVLDQPLSRRIPAKIVTYLAPSGHQCLVAIFFLDLSPKIKEIKAKINEWDLLKLKSFCTAKGSIDKIEKQPTESGKIFVNDVTNMGLISSIQNSSYNSTLQEQKPDLKNGQKT